MEFKKDNFIISDDDSKLNIDVICDFLSRAYWADKRPRDVIEKSIKHSLNFGVYDGDKSKLALRVWSQTAQYLHICVMCLFTKTIADMLWANG